MKKRILLATILVTGLSFQPTQPKGLKDIRIGKLPTLREVETVIKQVKWDKLVKLAPKAPGLVKKVITLIKDPQIKLSLNNLKTDVKNLNDVTNMIKMRKGMMTPKESLQMSAKTVESLLSIAMSVNTIVLKIRGITDEVAEDLLSIFAPSRDINRIKNIIMQIKTMSDTISKTLKEFGPNIIESIKKAEEKAKVETAK